MSTDPLVIWWMIVEDALKVEVLMHMRKRKSKVSLSELAQEGVLDEQTLKKCIWELHNECMITTSKTHGALKFELTEISKLFCSIIDEVTDWSPDKNSSDHKKGE